MKSRTQWNPTALEEYNRLLPKQYDATQDYLKSLMQGKMVPNEFDFPYRPDYRIVSFPEGHTMLFLRERHSWLCWKYMVITVEDIAPTAREIVIRQLAPKGHIVYTSLHFPMLTEISSHIRAFLPKQLAHITVAAMIALLVSSGAWISSTFSIKEMPPTENKIKLMRESERESP